MNVSGTTNVFQRDLDIIYGPIKGRSIANIFILNKYLIKVVSVVTMALLLYVVIVSKLYLLFLLFLTFDW